MKDSYTDKKITVFGVAAGLGEGILTGLIVVGAVFYFLVTEATKGSLASIVILTFCGSIIAMFIGGFVAWATIAINQKQDERAMMTLARMMRVNALENMMLLEQQKTRTALPSPDVVDGNEYLTIATEAMKGLEE